MLCTETLSATSPDLAACLEGVEGLPPDAVLALALLHHYALGEESPFYPLVEQLKGSGGKKRPRAAAARAGLEATCVRVSLCVRLLFVCGLSLSLRVLRYGAARARVCVDVSRKMCLCGCVCGTGNSYMFLFLFIHHVDISPSLVLPSLPLPFSLSLSLSLSDSICVCLLVFGFCLRHCACASHVCLFLHPRHFGVFLYSCLR